MDNAPAENGADTERLRSGSGDLAVLSGISGAQGLFRAIFHFNPLPTALIRVSDMRFVDVNRAFEAGLGYKASILREHTVFEFNIWVDGAMPATIVRLIAETGSIHGLQARHKRTDGGVRDVLLYFEPLEIGSELYMLNTFVDISDRRKAETDLENERIRLRTIIETIPDMIWMKSPEGAYLACNPRFERFFGAKEKDIVGKTDFDFLPHDLAEFFRAKDRAAIGAGKPRTNIEWVTYADDGHSELLETIKTPTYDSNGKLVGVLGIARDITERKRAEDMINQLNQNLERRVEERTAELTTANRELEAFAYSVSHDLRTPLRSINGFSHILADKYGDMLGEEGKRMTRIIRDNTARMGQLIDDLLAFSRLGRTEMRLAQVDMKSLAADVFRELGRDLGKKVDFRLAEIPPAQGDPPMLRQVWVNLLSNAIKFTGKKEKPEIQIGWEDVDGKTAYFVKDNGAGFDMRYYEKLFGVFQRLHGPREFEGTGVGLALVQRIISRHGGSIWAHAEVDAGACFFFTLNPGPQEVASPAARAKSGHDKDGILYPEAPGMV